MKSIKLNFYLKLAEKIQKNTGFVDGKEGVQGSNPCDGSWKFYIKYYTWGSSGHST